MTTTNTLGASDVNLLRLAVDLAKAGNKNEARTLIAEACLVNPRSEKAWLWRASLAPSTVDAIAWLERVLELNPENETARNWMQRLRSSDKQTAMAQPVAEPVAQPAAQPLDQPANAEPAESPWTCPLCSYESTEDLSRCPDCGAVTTLDLDAIEANTGADERQLKYAAEHYAKMLAAGDATYGYYLGLAYLNLRRSYDAEIALRRYLRYNPKDQDARMAAAKLFVRPLVLTVDDSPTVRSVVAGALERARYRCVPACSGVDALGYLTREAIPDFILLDVSMPVMDGYQLCKAIKQLPKARNVPVVMLSGNDGFIDKVKGRIAGAADYLTKPFNPETLLAVIRKHTRQGPK